MDRGPYLLFRLLANMCVHINMNNFRMCNKKCNIEKTTLNPYTHVSCYGFYTQHDISRSFANFYIQQPLITNTVETRLTIHTNVSLVSCWTWICLYIDLLCCIAHFFQLKLKHQVKRNSLMLHLFELIKKLIFTFLLFIIVEKQ